MAMKGQKAAALLLAATGLALLVMMIMTEGEFGALPLALVLAGLVWYVGCRIVERRDERR